MRDSWGGQRARLAAVTYRRNSCEGTCHPGAHEASDPMQT